MEEQALEKFHRIKTLSCYEEVEDMLYAGFPTSAVADFIQNQNSEYIDVKRKSLEEMLRLFRESLNDGAVIASTLPRSFVKSQQKFANKLEELEQLGELAQTLWYRFDVAHGHERLNNDNDVRVDRHARELRETLRTIHVIKMDLGLVGSRDLGTLTVSAERLEYIKNKYGEGAAKAFDNPVSRGRVLAALAALRRSGRLRDKEGNLIKVEERMDLNEREKRIVDVEFEAVDTVVAEEEEMEKVTEEEVDKPKKKTKKKKKKAKSVNKKKKSDLSLQKPKMPAAMREPENNLPPGPVKTGLKKIPRR